MRGRSVEVDANVIDIGRFGVGSDFSWQAIGGYGFDFGPDNDITLSGVIDDWALPIDYAEGEGRQRYKFDMIQRGPIFGTRARFWNLSSRPSCQLDLQRKIILVRRLA